MIGKKGEAEEKRSKEVGEAIHEANKTLAKQEEAKMKKVAKAVVEEYLPYTRKTTVEWANSLK